MNDRSIHPNTRILIDAWRRMSASPVANAVDDPRVAEHPDLITQLFVVQHSPDTGWMFRTAGQGLCDLLGRDLTNHDFLELWTGPDRFMMSHFMEAIRYDGAPGVIRGRGETLSGKCRWFALAHLMTRRACSACTRRLAANPCWAVTRSGATASRCWSRLIPVSKVASSASLPATPDIRLSRAFLRAQEPVGQASCQRPFRQP